MKVAFHTLGCKVNQYETEAMKEQFRRGGYEVVGEDDFADVYVVNTCTVTNLADRKSRQFIRRAQKINPEAVVAVTGCYAQMKPDEVSEIDGVQIITGTDEKHDVFNFVQDYLKKNTGTICIKPYDELTEYEDLGVIEDMGARTRAFIKIQEGCNRFCSYCIIPYARGNVRSRSESEIVSEVRGLVNKGYREIVLTGINTALYGADKGELGIEPLIARINAIEGEFRIRLSSLEPTVIDAEYVRSLLRYDKLCHHLHLSVQSGSDRVLKLMNRRYTREDYLDIVRVVREFDPLYGVSTDMIVGFPGETAEDHKDSLKLVDEAQFCRVHAFKYSLRTGTKAAEMGCQIPGEVKNERSEELIAAAEASAARFFKASENDIRRVLFETVEDEMMAGYTDNYIKTYVPAEKIPFNELYYVKLLNKYKDGMLGELVPGQERSR
jgi:threonylcarbamoyladenosine tRNA methylthiotransferase MtaB